MAVRKRSRLRKPRAERSIGSRRKPMAQLYEPLKIARCFDPSSDQGAWIVLTPVLWALHSRNVGHQNRAVLARVQVPPSALPRVVPARQFPTLWAGQARPPPPCSTKTSTSPPTSCSATRPTVYGDRTPRICA